MRISDHDGLGAGFGSFRSSKSSILALDCSRLAGEAVWCWCGEEAEMAGAAKLSSDIIGILLCSTVELVPP